MHREGLGDVDRGQGLVDCAAAAKGAEQVVPPVERGVRKAYIRAATMELVRARMEEHGKGAAADEARLVVLAKQIRRSARVEKRQWLREHSDQAAGERAQWAAIRSPATSSHRPRTSVAWAGHVARERERRCVKYDAQRGRRQSLGRQHKIGTTPVLRHTTRGSHTLPPLGASRAARRPRRRRSGPSPHAPRAQRRARRSAQAAPRTAAPFVFSFSFSHPLYRAPRPRPTHSPTRILSPFGPSLHSSASTTRPRVAAALRVCARLKQRFARGTDRLFPCDGRRQRHNPDGGGSLGCVRGSVSSGGARSRVE